MPLYYSTNCLLISAILVLLYVPDGPEVVISAGTITVDTAAFGGILLT